jgi:hypothetical protein
MVFSWVLVGLLSFIFPWLGGGLLLSRTYASHTGQLSNEDNDVFVPLLHLQYGQGSLGERSRTSDSCSAGMSAIRSIPLV